MKPAVLMMFRDEADVLGPCLQHWHEIGVQNFYLCDNGSKDGSLQIAIDFCESIGYEGVIISDDSTNWPGRKIINRLKEHAIVRGCDWLFAVDADEFLTLPGDCNRIQDWLCKYPQAKYWDAFGWGELPYLNILPDGVHNWQKPHKKAFGKLRADWMISMGNHIIEGVDPTLEDHGAFYRHYSIRSPEQFRKKMVNWMTAFSQMPYHDHPHYQNWLNWKREGDAFIERLYKDLTEYETNL